MTTTALGVGEYAASKTHGDVLRIIGLGSCVGVVALDPVERMVGLAHVALPDSSLNRGAADGDPGRFADTGIPVLLAEMARLGCGEASRLVIKLVGGAAVLDPHGTFGIGKRNVLAIRRILWRHGLGPIAEDVGGVLTRSVRVEVDTGCVFVSSPERGEWEI